MDTAQQTPNRLEWEKRNKLLDAQRSALELEIRGLTEKLGPPDRDMAFGELTRCLVLTAPTGMTEEDREAWLLAAFAEVQEVPAVMFADACKHARRTADHPAKIVPAIHGYKPEYAYVPMYRRSLDEARRKLENIDARRLAGPTKADGDAEREEVSSLMADLRERLSAARAPAPRAATVTPRPKIKYCSVCLFASDNPLTLDCVSNRAAGCGLSPDFAPPLATALDQEEGTA